LAGWYPVIPSYPHGKTICVVPAITASRIADVRQRGSRSASATATGGASQPMY